MYFFIVVVAHSIFYYGLKIQRKISQDDNDKQRHVGKGCTRRFGKISCYQRNVVEYT